MFDVDRFSAEENFGATYRHLCGQSLRDTEVRSIVSAVFEQLLSHSRDESCYDRFPTVLACLTELPQLQNRMAKEISLLERVFAAHEIGTIPETHAAVLRRLRETHRLGVVSNVWSKSGLYFKEFDRAGIRDLFDVIVFSSDHGHIKPSPYLFAKAVEAFDVELSKIVFVGDSLKRDIAGAKTIGLAAVWITPQGSETGNTAANVDLTIQDLRELCVR